MQKTNRIAGVAIIVFAVAGMAIFVLGSTAPRLGYDDTDSPAVMLSFVRAFPNVLVQAGFAMLVLSLSLTVAALAIAEILAPNAAALTIRVVTAFALFSAVLFLVSGGLHIQTGGPILYMASLSEAWGEAAFLAFQVTSQAAGILGLSLLCLWAVCVSVIGLRTKALPTAVCVLGLVPAFRLVGSILGPLHLLPESELLWLVSILALPGVMLWALLLGVVFLRRGFGRPAQEAVARADPGIVGA